MPTRRQALRAGAGALLGGAMGAVLQPAAARAASGGERHPLSRSRYAPLVGSTFRLMDRAGTRPVVLAAVTTARPGTSRATTSLAAERSFSLQFRDGAPEPLPDGIYGVAHPNLGTVPLFLASVGGTSGRYEAVVNRMAR